MFKLNAALLIGPPPAAARGEAPRLASNPRAALAAGLAVLLLAAESLAAATVPAERIVSNYGRLPLSFEANQGRTDPAARFLARGPGHDLFLTADGAVLTLRAPTTAAQWGTQADAGQADITPVLSAWAQARPHLHGKVLRQALGTATAAPSPRPDRAQCASAAAPGAVLRMNLVGANPAVPAGRERLSGTVNYFMAPAAPAPDLGDCPLFPADSAWNTPIDLLPVHPRSAAWVAAIGASQGFHMDFGSGTWNGGPIGIPYNVVAGSAVTHYPFDFYYPDESDPGPYPIPSPYAIEYGSDHHILVVDTESCRLYEIYDAWQDDGGWHGGSGAIWDLRSHALRPAGWTSADAAGLPILPGLARYPDILAGSIHHALRFTAPATNSYVWPARHLTAGSPGVLTDTPPMGARFRLKADYDSSGFAPELQVILRAMKTYGIILADNGSAWYVSGAPDERWDNDRLHDLDILKGSDFEAVDTGCLMVDSDSGQALPSQCGVPASARLVNLSTRGQVGTGDNVLIGGFVIGGTAAKQVLIRALGPSLTGAGVAGALADPSIRLTQVNGTPVADNDDWQTNGNAATIQSLGLAPTHAAESALLVSLPPGPYTPIVSGVGGTTGVALVEIYEVNGTETGPRLINISTRGQVGTGDNVLIGGFVIGGTASKQVLIRALGPSLTGAGVAGALANPSIRLTQVNGTPVADNDDWQTNGNSATIQSLGLAPTHAAESALLVTLPPGPYTPIVSGVGGTTGVGLVEIYEVAP